LRLGRRTALRLGAAGALTLGRRSHAAVPLSVQEVAPGIHVRQGICEDASPRNDDAIANVGFIVGDEAVAVIDPGGSRADGEALRAAVRAATDRPIRFVVESHVHPDHIFGAVAFVPDKPVVIAHARAAGAMAERGAYYRRRLAEILGPDAAGDYAVPTMPVADAATVDLGGRVLTLRAHRPAHTDNDLSVFDHRTAMLWAADLLFVGRIPVIDGSLTGWLEALHYLKRVPATRAVPGHGPASVPWPDGAADEERYLSTLAREIRAVIAAGGDIEAALRSVGLAERGRWCLFDDYNGRNVTAAFKELEWE
jgi:quinoprotein relay system zinc metallohydrolase 2